MKLRSNEMFFVDVFRRYFTRVLNYCKRLMRGPAVEMAEECAQNTFVQVQENITALKAHPNLAGWLFTTARNQVNAFYRKFYRRRKHEIAICDSIANQLTANSYELYEVLIATLDMDKMVRHVLNQLSHSETAFYVDYFKNRLSIQVLSKKYNLSKTAVTTRIYRLRKKIKQAARQALFG
ncbi:RNA polymerase sigma factor [Paenibacillus brevis]|uniref:Sigma-70 family RNA polymerase sigma factor n=1 Tax=Paenibacillus brevis TaxID=2841508 RepID=A0ABS6FQB8_9BACL|nr:sigma-70 family RNA polymerase sigma factor [Paenibacillus brevis]MBU5672154.1 sigma-70 family RNA polymerase sigma factor [Paenibacillus brevis]